MCESSDEDILHKPEPITVDDLTDLASKMRITRKSKKEKDEERAEA